MEHKLNFEALRQLLEGRSLHALRTALAQANEVDIAEFLEELPQDQVPVAFRALDKETAVFVEPRVVVANFREPYVNVNREASFTETSAMIQAGFRVCAANRKERASWGKYIFVPHFFTGLQVGGLKHMRSVSTVGDFALNYSGKFYLGYHLSRFATLKAAIEYETLNENKYDTYVVDFMGVEKQFTALWRYRYRFLGGGLRDGLVFRALCP